jgi:cytochrome b
VTGTATAGPEVGRETRPAEAGARTETEMVRVWDPFVRLFHWSLVGLFAAAYLTGDELEQAHEILGYAIIALLLLRIAWGFVGSPHARFSDFVYRPATVVAYARDAVAFRATRYLGHNPLGGVMVLLMIAGLLVTAGSGWLLTADEEAHWLEEVHEVAANGMLVLILLHVVGVLFSSFEHGENLVRSMVTGLKRAQ